MSRTTCQEFTLPRLDPRRPLVLDTHELERRPGTMRTFLLHVPSPAGLAIEVIGVPEGADVELDLRLESVLEGILVSGTARALAIGECARCLERVEHPLVVDLQALFAYPEHASPERQGSEGVDEDVGVVEGDLIDLEPAVRDAVVLALPLAPVCRDDCPGLCPECGALLAVEPGHSHDAIDPRWAALEAYGTAGADDETPDRATALARIGAATMHDSRPRAGRPEES